MLKMNPIIVKLSSIDFSCQNWFIGKSDCNIFDFRTLFHQGTVDQKWIKLGITLILIHLQGQEKNFDV